MTAWTVTVETDVGTDEETATRLVEALAAGGGAVSFSTTSTSITLTVDAATPPEAIARAIEVARAAGFAGDVAAAEAHAVGYEPRRSWPSLVGVRELADKLGVSRQRASELQARPGFPTPLQVLASGPVWLETWIDRFIETWPRRGGRPRKTTPAAGVGPSSAD